VQYLVVLGGVGVAEVLVPAACVLDRVVAGVVEEQGVTSALTHPVGDGVPPLFVVCVDPVAQDRRRSVLCQVGGCFADEPPADLVPG
jgi:hypothetical protein